MSGRSVQILSRFPNHLEAARPGKLLGQVAEALAVDLDVLAAALAAVRRAHRIGDADEITDILRIAALHGIRDSELELAVMRFQRGADRVAALASASDAAVRDAAAEALCALWGINAAPPRLALYAPPATGGTPDLDAARARLMQHAREALRYARLADALRRRVQVTCAIQSSGNGTVQALLEGAANALDLDIIGAIEHSDDRFWHAALVHDRMVLTRPVMVAPPPGSSEPAREQAQPFEPVSELIGVEENPLWRATTDSMPRQHAELFTLKRRGFERALLQAQITGEQNHTLGPMLVNRDEGHGIGYAGSVPAGQTLTFAEDGRVTLEGADVTSFAYAWQGACFADADFIDDADAVFDGEGIDPARRVAAFVTMQPAAALDREGSFPGAGENLPMPGISVGITRFAFFVQQAHYNSLEGSDAAPVVRLVTPRNAAAIFDGSVFAPGEAARNVAAKVALSWMEHRAFSARLLIAPRFRALEDDAEGVEVRRRVALAIERFRPLGVEVTVEFIDDRWVLGTGVITGGTGSRLVDQLRSGTVLWTAPAAPPS